MAAPTREALAKPDEVSEYIGVTQGTLANWRYLGRGPTWIRVSGRIRYRWPDVEAYLAQQARGGGRVA